MSRGLGRRFLPQCLPEYNRTHLESTKVWLQGEDGAEETSERSVGETRFSLQAYSFYKAGILLCTILPFTYCHTHDNQDPQSNHRACLQAPGYSVARGMLSLVVFAVCVASIGLRSPILPSAAS